MYKRNKQGQFTSIKTRFIRACKRTIIVLVVLTGIYIAFMANSFAIRLIDSSNALHDRIVRLERENAELTKELDTIEHKARASEALWWSESSDTVIAKYLKGLDTEAQAEMQAQGVRLENIRTNK